MKSGSIVKAALASILASVATLSLTTGCATNETRSEISAPLVDAQMNVIGLSPDNQISWNGLPVTADQLAALLRQTVMMDEEPFLTMEFEPNVDFERAGEVWRLIKESGVTKFGFVGNERMEERQPGGTGL